MTAQSESFRMISDVRCDFFNDNRSACGRSFAFSECVAARGNDLRTPAFARHTGKAAFECLLQANGLFFKTEAPPRRMMRRELRAQQTQTPACRG